MRITLSLYSDLNYFWVAIFILAIMAVSPRPLHAAEPLFESGFEPYTACLQPDEPCPQYQSCSDAEGEVWGCFELPYSAAPVPSATDGPGGPLFAQKVDIYFLIDRSGSMATEMSSLKTNLAQVRNSVACSPSGLGTPPDCIPDLWAGAGTIGYAAGSPYLNHTDIHPNPSFVSLPTTESAGCCSEATALAAWSSITGLGQASSACTAATFQARSTCVGSPAANAGYGTFGYPCFRDAALPVVFVYTDEAPTENLNCPLLSVVATTAQAAGVKLVGMLGSGATTQAGPDLTTLATGSGAVDTKNASAAMVFVAADANAATATSQALLTLHAGIPLNSVKAFFVDEAPLDGIDLQASFVDLIVATGGGADCLTEYPATDTDDDDAPDSYDEVPSGATVCWQVVAKQNLGVPAKPWVQLFRARLEIRSGLVPLESLSLVFIVPAT